MEYLELIQGENGLTIAVKVTNIKKSNNGTYVQVIGDTVIEEFEEGEIAVLMTEDELKAYNHNFDSSEDD